MVFPGRRPAHFLRRRLAQRAGRGFLPPVILSLDELVDEVFERRTARDGRVLPRMEPIDAAALLYEIQLGADRPIGGSAFMTLDRFFPIGLKVFADIEELLIEEVPERKVAEVQPLVEEEVPVRSRERLQTLARFSSLFYPAAAAQGLSTRSSRYRFVSETIEEADAPGTGPLIIAGFFALTGPRWSSSRGSPRGRGPRSSSRRDRGLRRSFAIWACPALSSGAAPASLVRGPRCTSTAALTRMARSLPWERCSGGRTKAHSLSCRTPAPCFLFSATGFPASTPTPTTCPSAILSSAPRCTASWTACWSSSPRWTVSGSMSPRT